MLSGDTDRKSKIVLFGIALIVVIVFLLSVFKFAFSGDYVVVNKIACDPMSESCFVEECREKDPRCEEQSIDGMHTYKYISANASDIYCSNEDSSCFTSCENIPSCFLTYCDEEIDDVCQHTPAEENPEFFYQDEVISYE